MSADLDTFLAGLATDPERFGSFLDDPAETARASGLSEADVAILFSGDPDRIYTALRRVHGDRDS